MFWLWVRFLYKNRFEMNIYIPIEIKVRELEGKFLLALIAAERGHTVLLGDKSDTRKLAVKGILPQGIYHNKSLTPGDGKDSSLYKIHQNGYIITSQDEESGLLDESYEKFAKLRFSDETISLASKVFAWGEHDEHSLKEMYPQHKERVLSTGSPRVDFWRQDFKNYYDQLDTHNTNQLAPYILVVSNFGSLLDANRFWDRAARLRTAGYFDRDPNWEAYFYKNSAYQLQLIYEFIVMIRELSETYPALNIVVRPHPVESVEGWKKVLGDNLNNVIINRKGTISNWIRNSSLIIHNGCTSALEAAVCGTPRIAYRPLPSEYERDIPNRISFQADSLSELKNMISDITSGNSLETEHEVSEKTDELISRRLENSKGSFAADNIVDAWEALAKEHHLKQNEPDEFLNLKPGDTVTGRFKKKAKEIRSVIFKNQKTKTKLLSSAHKFPDFKESEVQNMLKQLQVSFDRFHNVKFKKFGKKTYLFYRGNH
jgi:surface carbohydrate biosynthesis protein